MRDDNSRSSGLVDLKGLSLEKLTEVDEAWLRRMLEPLLLEKAEPAAGFTSSI